MIPAPGTISIHLSANLSNSSIVCRSSITKETSCAILELSHILAEEEVAQTGTERESFSWREKQL